MSRPCRISTVNTAGRPRSPPTALTATLTLTATHAVSKLRGANVPNPLWQALSVIRAVGDARERAEMKGRYGMGEVWFLKSHINKTKMSLKILKINK